MKTKQLTQFRRKVYQNFNNCKRTATLMGLVDTISSNTTARSVVELSLNLHFRRHYTALNKAVKVNALPKQKLAELACQTIGTPSKWKFHLLATDATSAPRSFAETLKELPFGKAFCVEVADSAYGKPAYLSANREHADLVTIARARGTRIFYHQPVPEEQPAEKGHPTWYGKPFHLKAPETWGAPDQLAETTFISHKQVTYRVEIQAWHDLVLGEKRRGCSPASSLGTVSADKQPTPAMVLRDMSRILRQIGTPAPTPKPRGKSPGSCKGAKFTPRIRQPVMKKTAA